MGYEFLCLTFSFREINYSLSLLVQPSQCSGYLNHRVDYNQAQEQVKAKKLS